MTTANSDLHSLSDRELLERVAKQLDHVDVMTHEIAQFITEHKPALTKALGMLENPIGRTLAKMKAGHHAP